MSADVQTDEQIVAVPGIVAAYLVRTPMPNDTSVSTTLRQYEGNTRHPNLSGLATSVSVFSADRSFVDGLVLAVLGVGAEPDEEPREHVGSRWTDWHDGNVRISWAEPLAEDEPTEPDEVDVQDVLDDRKWEAFHEAGGHR